MIQLAATMNYQWRTVVVCVVRFKTAFITDICLIYHTQKSYYFHKYIILMIMNSNYYVLQWLWRQKNNTSNQLSPRRWHVGFRGSSTSTRQSIYTLFLKAFVYITLCVGEAIVQKPLLTLQFVTLIQKTLLSCAISYVVLQNTTAKQIPTVQDTQTSWQPYT